MLTAYGMFGYYAWRVSRFWKGGGGVHNNRPSILTCRNPAVPRLILENKQAPPPQCHAPWPGKAFLSFDCNQGRLYSDINEQGTTPFHLLLSTYMHTPPIPGYVLPSPILHSTYFLPLYSIPPTSFPYTPFHLLPSPILHSTYFLPYTPFHLLPPPILHSTYFLPYTPFHLLPPPILHSTCSLALLSYIYLLNSSDVLHMA